MSILNIFSQVEISHYIYLSTVLFCIGLFGVLFRRNAIILLMCIELMLNAVNCCLPRFHRIWVILTDKFSSFSSWW